MKKKDQYDPAFLSVQDKIHEAKEKTDSKASKAMVNIIGDLGSIPNVTPQGKDAANASSDVEVIKGWHVKWPNANWGVATGRISGS